MQRFIFRAAAVAAAVAMFAAGALVFQGCGDDTVKPNDQFTDDPYNPPNVVTDGKSADELIADGYGVLMAGDGSIGSVDFDEAFAYFEAAYKKDPNNVQAVAVSSLAKIASVSIDPKVAALFKEHFGFEKYPNTFNALVDVEGWMKNYPEFEYWYYDDVVSRYVEWISESEVQYYRDQGVTKAGYYYGSYDWDNWSYNWSYYYTFVSSTPRTTESWFPGLNTPSWIKGDKTSVYSQSLLNGQPSMETWAILLFSNIVDKNTSGFNGLLDDVISSVFGDNGPLAEASRRIAGLKGKPGLFVDRDLIELLGFDEVLTGEGEIGWAELNIYVSYITGMKAALEWVAAYDWSTNLSVLKDPWKAGDEYAYDRFKKLSVNDMPFKSNLLNARSGKMAASKRDFVAALKGIDESYKIIRDNPLYPHEVAVAYPVVHDAVTNLVDAIDKGKVFWVPDPESGISLDNLKWPTGNGPNVLAGLDMGKFFQEGYFSLQNLFETESDRTPVFYTSRGVKLTRNNYIDILEEGISANYDDDWEDGYEWYSIGLKLKTSTVTGLVVEGGSGSMPELTTGDQITEMFPPEFGVLLFAKYNGLELPDVSDLYKKRAAQVALLKDRSKK